MALDMVLEELFDPQFGDRNALVDGGRTAAADKKRDGGKAGKSDGKKKHGGGRREDQKRDALGRWARLPGGMHQVLPSPVEGFDVYERHGVRVQIPHGLGLGALAGKGWREATPRAELLRTVGDLAGQFPRMRGSFVVSSRGFGTSGQMERTLGLTDLRLGVTALSPRLLNASRAQDEFQMTVDQGAYQPSAKTTNVVRYVVAHEAGHLMEQGAAEDAVARAEREAGAKPSGSYAALSAHEAFAEGFAEFVVTDGTTTDPFTRALAADQGWRP